MTRFATDLSRAARRGARSRLASAVPPTAARPGHEHFASLLDAPVPSDGRRGPKYKRLHDALLRAIEQGRWRPGERLPTEAELTRVTPFSLGTVQRAIRALVEQGLVVRRQGQGSFLTDRRARLEDPLHCRFPSDDGLSLLPVFPTVVARRTRRESGPWNAYLGTESRPVLRIERTLDIGDEFRIYSDFFADPRRFPSLARRPLAELNAANFKALIRSEFDLPVTHLRQCVWMEPLPARVCTAIGLAADTVGMVVEIVAFAGRGRAVYYQQLFLPPGARKLLISDALGACRT